MLFELWCWRRLLRVPWTARRSNQSILKVISPEYSLEGLMLKLQYFGCWCEELTHLKRPDAGKDWRQEEMGTTENEMVGWHHWLNGHEFEQAPRVDDRQASLVYCSPWGFKVLDMTEQLNWTERSSTWVTLGRLKQRHTSNIAHVICARAVDQKCLFVSPWTIAHQDPLSMWLFRQKYWSGLPFPPPGNIPESRIKLAPPVSPALASRVFTTVQTG